MAITAGYGHAVIIEDGTGTIRTLGFPGTSRRPCCRSSRSTRVPRAGLNGDNVVAAAAGLADEIGFQAVTMGLLADQLDAPHRPCTSAWPLADLQGAASRPWP